MILYIKNNEKCHYEILESLIVKYQQIIGTNDIQDIYLSIVENPSFREYISSKYPNLKWETPEKFDYIIYATFYPKHFRKLKLSDKKKEFFICHRFTDKINNFKNVFFLTPLGKQYIYADVLPFTENRRPKPRIPYYVIQGTLSPTRRNFELLKILLATPTNYQYRIKVIGKGSFDKVLFKNNWRKIILKRSMDFQSYHREFLDCYCLIPLLTKESHPQYYNQKLTSSINYAKAYNLKCLIDQNLQNIYNLPDVEVFQGPDDIQKAFLKTLEDFYTNQDIVDIQAKNNMIKANAFPATK